MNTLIIKDKFTESLNSVIRFFSQHDTSFDFLAIWPASLKPSKSFSDISKESEDLNKQLSLICDVVSEVLFKRADSLKEKDVRNLLKGRFLIYSPLHATMDALASGETSGFFDEADVPPWSTWVSFSVFKDVAKREYEGYLVAWIPERLIAIAQAGIDVSLGGSLFWADDVDEVRSYGKNAVDLCNAVLSECPSYLLK